MLSSPATIRRGGGFAAAGRSYQNDKFVVSDFEAEILHCQHAFIGDGEVSLLPGFVFFFLLFFSSMFGYTF